MKSDENYSSIHEVAANSGIHLPEVSETLNVEEGGQGGVTSSKHEGVTSKLLYKIDERPPWFFLFMFAMQHYMSMFIATLTIPILLAPAMCMGEDNVGKAEIIGTLFVTSGLITLMQNLVGVRLPVVQAGTFALLVPTLAYLKLPQWECPTNIVNQVPVNGSASDYIITASDEHKEIWMSRLREVQGAVMCASLLEVVLGVTGIVGFLLRYIGPLTIAPTIGLLGMSLFKSAGLFAAKQWWICLLTIGLMVVFSQYMDNVSIPCPAYTKTKGLHVARYPLLKMFPVILAILISWIVSLILTLTDVLPKEQGQWGHEARTDLRTAVIFNSPWWRVPYPGQWGIPTVSLSAVVALVSGVIATTIESIGDYHACAKLCDVPPPPLHAVNRGIFMEGVGSFIDGLFGTGNGTTSTSINVGVVGLTKVASRSVVMLSAGFMIVFGIFTKFGALFVTIPDPVIAGAFFILFGMIIAVGMSNLQYVDLNSSRNLFIIGISFFTGLAVPEWVNNNQSAFKTGNETLDSVCLVLLSTPMVLGGLIGFFFDNTIKGTPKERGLTHWSDSRKFKKDDNDEMLKKLAVYDLPFGMKWIRSVPWLRSFPLSPTYKMPFTTTEVNENNEFHTDL